MTKYILSIDQGTTSSRAILFNEQARIVRVAQQEFTQYFPQDGWVEHDPEEIWQTTVAVVREVIDNSGVVITDIAAVGIANQRETTILWDRHTGEPVYRAIVWQDRRTAEYCEELKNRGLESTVADKTGLLLDPYFSATKVKWILDNVEGVRKRAAAGEIVFGTVDSFLLWRLSAGKSHKTDATNASRTMLFNIYEQQWDAELCEMFNIPMQILPEVEDSSAEFGKVDAGLFGGEIPITGIAGDQQAALIGQCCFEEGMTKSTYGTGCFIIMNTGEQAIKSDNKLLTTVAYRMDGKTVYGIEGSIFTAGAAVQWLRDGLQVIEHAADTEAIASQTGDSAGVYLVPAFTGLGAPYWDPDARGALLGLTRDTGIKEIVTATLEAVCYQTRDLLEAISRDGTTPTVLRVDGGMVNNNWLVQSLADMLDLAVDRPVITETTALGACYLAGLRVGFFDSMAALQSLWQRERRFTPAMKPLKREKLYRGWLDAVSRIRS
ncbi:MAG: glycerol kinase GlpK [Gammaproteobacteria bacterium]|nr:glycerol kinase GlpK [Gammaproteobacteria bacterium]